MNILQNHRQTSAALLFAFAAFAIPAQAATIATIYQNDPNAMDASVVPLTTLPNATFTTNNIDYNAHFGGVEAAGFLYDPTFTNQQNGFDPNTISY